MIRKKEIGIIYFKTYFTSSNGFYDPTSWSPQWDTNTRKALTKFGNFVKLQQFCFDGHYKTRYPSKLFIFT